MSLARIREGDQVIVITGRARGQRGTVTKKRHDGRVVIDGVNLVAKNVRPDPNQGIQGGIEEREAPLRISNVMIYNPTTKRQDRVGTRMIEDGGGKRKVRVYKSSGEVIDD